MTHRASPSPAIVLGLHLIAACSQHGGDGAGPPPTKPEGRTPLEAPSECDPGIPFSWQREEVPLGAVGRLTSAALAAADLDGDGTDELAVGAPDGRVRIWARTDSAWAEIGNADLGGPVEMLLLADLSGDGRADLAGASPADSVLRVARGSAPGAGFESVEVVPVPAPVSSLASIRLSERATGVIIGSVAASEPETPARAWLLESLRRAPPIELPLNGPVAAKTVFAPGDFDQDGDEDLAGGGEWLENLGDGRFSSHPLRADLLGVVEMSVADFDGDAYPDIAAMEGYSFRAFRNTGRSSFEQVWEVFQIYGLGTVAGYVDCDDRPDLVGIAGQQALQLFLGREEGFSTTPSHIAPGDALGVRIGDFDGDARLDLAQPAYVGTCEEDACELELHISMAR